MRMYDIIKKKRDGGELDKSEIDFFIRGFVEGSIPSYQASALLMAIYFNGMDMRETVDLTFAIRDSGGVKLNIDGVRADKHSTGGVGDKTSLIVMPIVASLGIKAAKMSGRALGHTGGTVDKLESIGVKTDMDAKTFEQTVNKVGLSIVGQSDSLAPADKLLYALRDVTATVDSAPLIASSIMGKKLAAGDDIIVLDVKTGSGAFMKTPDESKALAKMCVEIGKNAGKKISAVITDMDEPLGESIGNLLEVKEAIEVLHGGGADDLKAVSFELASEILRLAGFGSKDECLHLAKKAICGGTALKCFADMVKAQGGKWEWVIDPSLIPASKYSYSVKAEENGYMGMNAEKYGLAALSLGAGRNTMGDRIDWSAGIVLKHKTGDRVSKGEEICILYSDKNDFSAANDLIREGTFYSGISPQKKPLIYEWVN